MIEEFKIYIDRLKNGDVQKIEGNFSPELLDIEEDDIRFNAPVTVSAESYLADDHLILNISAATTFEMRCSICNEFTKKTLTVTNDYQTEAISEIRSAIYDFGIALREALLVELPQIVECNEGNCPMRKVFLRPNKGPETSGGNFPFSDLT